MPVEPTEPNVLVVEVRDEELFFGAFVKHLKLQDIQVMGIGGKTKLKDNLEALRSMRRFPQVVSLGVVRDANENPGAAFESVRGALQAVNLPVPERPLVPAGDSPRVTVMILPEEGTPGMLEDLCLRAVVQDPAMVCVEQYFQCLQQQELSLPHNTSKAKVQVFLASKPEVGRRLGEAAGEGYWSWDHVTFEQARKFLQQLVRKGNSV